MSSEEPKWGGPSTVPPYGWKQRCDYNFPQDRKQKLRVNAHQLRVLLPLILRYVWYSVKLFFNGRKPVMNFFKVVENKKKSGVPLGGIGSGIVGRGFRGEFCRFQMDPGNYQYEDVIADQFIATVFNDEGQVIYKKVLSTYHSALSAWDWTFPATDMYYTALYPQAWTEYKIVNKANNIDLELVCHQISPVIPNNYKDSCIPACVFEWSIKNNSTKNCQVAITMTIRDGDGSKCCTRKGLKTSEKFEKVSQKGLVKGLTIRQKIIQASCNYSVASLQNDDATVTLCPYFDPQGSGKKFWKSLSSDAEFESQSFSGEGKKYLGVAVRSLVKLNGCIDEHAERTESSICFSFSWDMPKVHFAHSQVDHLRFYTQFFGSAGESGPDMCLYAIDNFDKWASAIFEWQKPILTDDRIPDWYKSALFNELYYVSDGGTVWLLLDDEEVGALPPEDPRKSYGRFAYLEGHEYKMYNTYDVHFYASFALAMLWPELQKSLQYDFKDSISKEDKTMIWYLYDGDIAARKVKNSVPHDLGEPDDDPFNIINVYPVHDVSKWKDLNTKFVLQVYRDFVLTEDTQYLKDMYPAVVNVMNKTLRWDTENLGMIMNEGFPDQTYDTWVMLGVSAYCGGLFLAAVKVTIEMAKRMEDEVTQKKFEDILARGKEAFESHLWNGTYYRFDASKDRGSDTIMSDQLCGLWYLKTSNVQEEVFPKDHVRSALRTIYTHNVLKYFNGAQGAVNGMLPNGDIDVTATQSEESWTGVTYALASLMLAEGMEAECFKTAGGLYETLFNLAGMGFATPEALNGLDSYRAVGYMRPLSIWSIQRSLDLYVLPHK